MPSVSPTVSIVRLDDRGVVSVTGADAVKLLQGLLTNDLDRLGPAQPSLAAGLLSPQGKILFDLIAYRAGDGLLLETAADKAGDLAKRIGLYKLRAAASVADMSADWTVVATWDGEPGLPPEHVGGPDPRAAEMGGRWLLPRVMAGELVPTADAAAYHARRVAHGVPEAGRDFALGDTFPHEADYDLHGGVSFTKGCYVGQEVVARMQHKTVVRKRVVRIVGADPLTEGVDVVAGEFVVGRVGTVAGDRGLAFLKLDRVEELAAKGLGTTAGGVPVAVDPRDVAALADLAASKARRT